MTDDDLLHSRYSLVEVLGQGAMGVVWRAHDAVLDRDLALKELRPGPGVDPTEAKERFLVEARAAARLSHPNIVAVHDVFVEDDRVLIAMELVEGPTLEELVRAGAQPTVVVREVMAQVAQALASAHAVGVVHRDLKPDNIFWNNGRAVVADFGLARIGTGRGTLEGTVMGTPGYMAPEQVKGSPTAASTDVFGWAAVAYQLAAGHPPFGDADESDPVAMAYRIVHQDPPTLDLPDDPALAALITRALAKDPAERPADGTELVAALIGEMASGEAVAVGSEPSADELTAVTPVVAESSSLSAQPSASEDSEPMTAVVLGSPSPDTGGVNARDDQRSRRSLSTAGIGAVLAILVLSGALAFTIGRSAGSKGDVVIVGPTSTVMPRSTDPPSTIPPPNSTTPTTGFGNPIPPPGPTTSTTTEHDKSKETTATTETIRATTTTTTEPLITAYMTRVDDVATLFINGEETFVSKWGYIGTAPDYQYAGHQPGESGVLDITTLLKPGKNSIRFIVNKSAGCCGVSGFLGIYRGRTGRTETLVRDGIDAQDSVAGTKFDKTWVIER
ncbi:MAG: serine/threonine-protein kinase [Acidimicrobiales bacterium]